MDPEKFLLIMKINNLKVNLYIFNNFNLQINKNQLYNKSQEFKNRERLNNLKMQHKNLFRKAVNK